MSEIDWGRLQPLRVAVGSHGEGTGYGCAMNVVSYITGESVITDYPLCADHTLARIVQMVNDYMPSVRKQDSGNRRPTPPILLSPEDALAVIELGTLTIGTRVDHTDLGVYSKMRAWFLRQAPYNDPDYYYPQEVVEEAIQILESDTGRDPKRLRELRKDGLLRSLEKPHLPSMNWVLFYPQELTLDGGGKTIRNWVESIGDNIVTNSLFDECSSYGNKDKLTIAREAILEFRRLIGLPEAPSVDTESINKKLIHL